jgi:hypothetical protein
MAIGQHGCWNRSTLSGYKVVFVPFEARIDRVRSAPISLKKSKIERPQNSRKCGFLDVSAAAIFPSADTKLHRRFSEKRFGPSRRRAKNASVVISIFVRHPKGLFQQYPPRAVLH